MGRRRAFENKVEMNRLYVIETTPTNTGAIGDHTWTVKPSEFLSVAVALATGSGVDLYKSGVAQPVLVHEGPFAPGQPGPPPTSQVNLPIDAIVRDLQQNKGASIVLAGEHQPPIIHALAHAMNNALGNVGKTVFYTDSLEVNPVDQRQSLQDLVGEIDAGRVELLVIVGGNPVYNTPSDLKLNFERLDKNVKLRVHLSEYKDETTRISHWHVPQAHYLESWADARSFDGTVTILQPLIQPLYDGKTVNEFLAVFLGHSDQKALDIVK